MESHGEQPVELQPTVIAERTTEVYGEIRLTQHNTTIHLFDDVSLGINHVRHVLRNTNDEEKVLAFRVQEKLMQQLIDGGCVVIEHQEVDEETLCHMADILNTELEQRDFE